MKILFQKKYILLTYLAVLSSSALILSACDTEDTGKTVSDNGSIIIDSSLISGDESTDNKNDSPISITIENDIVSHTDEADSIENNRDDLEPVSDSEGNEDPKDETTHESEDISEDNDLEDISSDENADEDAVADDNTETASSEEEAAPVTPGAVEAIAFNPAWTYADFSMINSGSAMLYRAAANRKNIVIAVNAGHGTKGGQSVKTYCHPDMTPKVTGGSTAAGSITAIAVSGGMSFHDGTAEASVTLRMAQILRDKLLANGFDVLMIRDGADVQLDNIARTVIANNNANCHIALHWDGDGLDYDKGCFYISTPEGIKNMEPVASNWTKHEALGQSLISGLTSAGCKIYKNGAMAIDLTQTSYSTIPSVDIELGNAASVHDDAALSLLADGLVKGISSFF